MTQTSERNRLIRRLHVVLRDTGKLAYKADIIAAYNVEHVSELDNAQLQDCINGLIDTGATARALRSDVLSLLQKIGVYCDNRDWNRVNEYLRNPRIAGKLLYEMSHNELRELRVKLNSILAKKNTADAETLRLTQNN